MREHPPANFYFASDSKVIRILYVAYPLLTVTNESAGGAEQVLWALEREMMEREMTRCEMARRGILTAVAASTGSRVSGELFSTGEPCTQSDDYERRRSEHEGRVVEFVRRRARQGRPFDLIHDMSGSFWRRAAEIETPVLATLHLPRSFYPPESFHNVAASVSFNCVSHAQARSFADLGALAGVVANGIALDCFDAEPSTRADYHPHRREGLLWLGRICEEKAPHMALEIAARAGLPIKIAGQVYPFSYHQQYFEREVVPRLQRMANATFVSAPTAELKRRLLRDAEVLLITSLADETSSLVAMEAAASGTPVVAFRRGALVEVVRDGVTGFLVEGVDDAATALQRIPEISPAACVRHARKNFSAAKMAEGYLQVYERLVNSHPSDLLTAAEADIPG
jgi:glycosyltransferase involved in cell wall biosynthesis